MALQAEILDLIDDVQEATGRATTGNLDTPDRLLILIAAALAAIELRLAAIEANTAP
jgi:hypothetical protein